MSGLLSLLTDTDNPKPMGISLSDHLSGMVACNGIMAALISRGATGKGQRVDTSLLEATISFCGENAARYFENGKVPARATRTHQAQVYAFVAKDKKAFVVHLSSPNKFWEALCRVAGHPEWVQDARFATKETRGKNYVVLETLLADIFKTEPREHWLGKLLEADVPSAPLNTFDDVFSDPQVKHLGMRKDVMHKRVGMVGLIRNGVRMSETPPAIHSAAPELGEHTDEVLAELKLKV
jgi:formyl-CoA transferase